MTDKEIWEIKDALTRAAALLAKAAGNTPLANRQHAELDSLSRNVCRLSLKLDEVVQMKFRELAVGDTFDWIDDSATGHNSYYDRCVKLSQRTYTTVERPASRYIMRVGSVNANVFHVQRKEATNVHV